MSWLAGATGRSGIECVKSLLEDGCYRPLLHVRSTSSAKGKLAKLPDLPVIACDVTTPKADQVLARAIRQYSAEHVICTLGFVPTFDPAADMQASDAIDNKGVQAVIRACEMARMPGRFVLVSSLLASTTPRNLSARLLNSLGGVLDAKRESETALASSSLDYTILRPGVFAESVQGGLVVGEQDRFIGADSDSQGLGLQPVSCASPFLASSGAVCAITRQQVSCLIPVPTCHSVSPCHFHHSN